MKGRMGQRRRVEGVSIIRRAERLILRWITDRCKRESFLRTGGTLSVAMASLFGIRSQAEIQRLQSADVGD
jgi:hypothetical protein